ncbi:MAG: DinB family protein [Firmicutes bacterium]|nr:DinB family protein [Bacillota bacterium]
MDVRKLTVVWEQERAMTRKLAAAIPAGKEKFQAAPGAMAAGLLVLHCLSAEKTAVEALGGTDGRWEWDQGLDLEHYPTVESILEVLDERTEATRRYFAGLSDADLGREVRLPWGEVWTLEEFWVKWMTHEAYHRGNLLTTLRVMGVEPPNIWG